ncbi:MAG: UbiD family decarboxylase, partial [Candidatus Methanomethylicia archaeon]
MNLRNFISKLEAERILVKIDREVSVEYEVANILAALDGKPVYFSKIKESNIPIIGNILSSRELVAKALNI